MIWFPPCKAAYDDHRGLRSVGPLHNVLHAVSQSQESSCQSDHCWDFPTSGREDGATGYRRRSCSIPISCCTATQPLSELLSYDFTEGTWWNREGTKVALIQLHRSQYYSNTTYRLKDGCLWAARCLTDTHPTLHWVDY